ncbi:MAG: ABC transporter substrate-binding protein [Candidatus Thorarchaeota archaeon]
MSERSALIRREFAIIAIIAGLGIGILGGWFIPSPIVTTRTPLLDQIIARNSFIVGTSADYPPFENKTFPGGVIIGFDIDLSQLIADEIGVPLQMVDIPFDSLIAACSAGTIDMIAAAMTYTEDRAENLAPSITYFNAARAVVALNDSGITIGTIDDVTAYTVGVQSGTVMYEELGPEGLDMIIDVELFVYDNAQDLMIALDTAAIQLAYVDEPVFEAWKSIYNLELLFDSGADPLAMWTRYGEPELLYVMNKVIYESYMDESIYELINLWFGNVTV